MPSGFCRWSLKVTFVVAATQGPPKGRENDPGFTAEGHGFAVLVFDEFEDRAVAGDAAHRSRGDVERTVARGAGSYTAGLDGVGIFGRVWSMARHARVPWAKTVDVIGSFRPDVILAAQDLVLDGAVGEIQPAVGPEA